MTTAPRVWLITGASRGLGRAFAEAALAAGDRVVAISRTPEPLGGDSLAIAADVTDRAAVFAAVEQAVAHFGRLDVVVNNAGAMWLGAIEEFSEDEARAAMELNFFGALWVTQAVTPHLRERGGRLLQVSSVAGVATGATAGMYSAAKFALEGMSEALAQELALFDVKVTIVEPGGYWTDLYRTGMFNTEPLEAYAPLRSGDGGEDESVDSDPKLAAEAVMKLVDSEDPPLRLVLGSAVLDAMIAVSKQRIATWEQWEEVSRAAEHAIPMPAGYLDGA
ncbi:SDR family NAD(P)-dependent oxidoreductase [Solirubrobacter taibaiensis]|nr:SDR family NAD(P)-dependent oxidoreductase [Solirubrobacter taibaiensis]